MHDFQIWRLARESWKFAVIYCPFHASLRYLAELISPPPSDIRPDASRLRTVHSSCADGDRLESSPPQTLQQRCLTAETWLMTFHCFSKSTVLFDSPSRKIETETGTWCRQSPCSPKFSPPFLLCTCSHGVTTEWNIYTKTSFKKRKSWFARQQFEWSNLSQVLEPPSIFSVLRCVDRAA